MRDKRVAGGLGLIAAALVLGETEVQTHALPDPVMGVLFYGLFLGGCTLSVIGWRSVLRRSKQTAPALDGPPVQLAVVPNVALAQLWQQRLHDEGIEAAVGGTLLRLPGMPVELFVGEHDLDRARELFPELQHAS